MVYSPKKFEEKLNLILPRVQRPGRYTGGELNQVTKDWSQVKTKVVLAFPDIYDLGMSNYGLAILYDLINQRPDALAERTFNPWTDMEAIMREEDVPLYSLESKRPLNHFDIIGISIPYETLFTNTLNLLALGHVPMFSRERTEEQHQTQPVLPFLFGFVRICRIVHSVGFTQGSDFTGRSVPRDSPRRLAGMNRESSSMMATAAVIAVNAAPRPRSAASLTICE